MVHRDLKPSNVLLAADGTPKVSDFGIARLQDAQTDPDVAGTPHYMAPEQARGEPVDARADVYALGAVLFELLTGQTPFLGDAAAVLVAAERTAPPRVRRIRPGVPAAVDAVCARCLCHDPHGRYDTAHALAADLGRFLSGRPVEALSDPDLLRVVGRGYFFAARTYQQIGRQFEWAEAERKAVSFRRKLLVARPAEFGPADDLAHSLAFLGDALGAETDPDAEQAYAEAVKLWDALEDRHPTATVTLTNRVIALAGVAASCLGQDRFPQAKEALARGRELLDRIPPDQAGSADALTAGRHHHNRAAQFRAGQGDHVGCASAAAELVRGRERDTFALGSAAFHLARCRTLAERDETLPRPDRAKMAADYAELAVKRLGAAVDAGYGDLTFVESRVEYRALADRPDFRAVLAKLKANQK